VKGNDLGAPAVHGKPGRSPFSPLQLSGNCAVAGEFRANFGLAVPVFWFFCCAVESGQLADALLQNLVVGSISRCPTESCPTDPGPAVPDARSDPFAISCPSTHPIVTSVMADRRAFIIA